MAACGICGGKIGRTMVPHGAICKDNTKAPSIPHEIDNDLTKVITATC